ncbi:hypothetical protein NKF06_00825 [Haloferax sp. AB510]|uniref:hypothetical protein n=1 Tax=Haloferax sp. AB510 TaxID=2934172 RepID=UPI00209BD845|nr:hypothetical protein [Haloferax sp. AB510]MCO8265165.1 hypothetical protein [Haloferax sp. AB510]
MTQHPRRRVLGILVLLGCLFGLMVWFGSLAPAPGVGAYPGSEELGTDYDAWVGDQVSLTGTVIDTDPLTISAEYGAGEQVRLRVTDAAVDAQQGDSLSVYGVVEPDRTIRSLNAYTVPPGNYLYMYAVSFLAGLWVLGRIIRSWRLDETWSLVPRETPLGIGDFTTQSTQSEDHDA